MWGRKQALIEQLIAERDGLQEAFTRLSTEKIEFAATLRAAAEVKAQLEQDIASVTDTKAQIERELEDATEIAATAVSRANNAASECDRLREVIEDFALGVRSFSEDELMDMKTRLMAVDDELRHMQKVLDANYDALHPKCEVMSDPDAPSPRHETVWGSVTLTKRGVTINAYGRRLRARRMVIDALAAFASGLKSGTRGPVWALSVAMQKNAVVLEMR